jgi:predicted metal-dependent HD superfamily phosphohydrolase
MTEVRFVALWNRCAVDGDAAKAASVYADLARRYAEPHRRYHTFAHINHCLGQLDLASGLMDNGDAVEMGLWFHDVIYNPRASDNELKSAQLFTGFANPSMDGAFSRSVYDLIMVTAHPEDPKCRDEEFMVDIDLSSFALPWQEFKRDSAAVRSEYAYLPDDRFFAGQIRFLRELLARPTFFFTAFFRDRYEASARKNITRHIDQLQARGYS